MYNDFLKTFSLSTVKLAIRTLVLVALGKSVNLNKAGKGKDY